MTEKKTLTGEEVRAIKDRNKNALAAAIRETLTDEFQDFDTFHKAVAAKLYHIARFKQRGVEYIDLYAELNKIGVTYDGNKIKRGKA